MMGIKRTVSYPKAMRELAKQRGEFLVTVDVPGVCVQMIVPRRIGRKVADVALMLAQFHSRRHAASKPKPKPRKGSR